MKAQNLTISVPYKSCDKNCLYCVSKMTGYMESNFELMKSNIEKVKSLARAANISSVLFTSKGEPFKNINEFLTLLDKFQEWPAEIQTNGLSLNTSFRIKEMNLFEDLIARHVNVIAFSIDDKATLFKYRDMFHYLHNNGILVRVTLNVIEGFYYFDDFVNICINCYVDQLSFRQITIPTNFIDTSVAKATAEWIRENIDVNTYDELKCDMLEKLNASGHLLMILPYGTKVYDYKGISVTYFDECIQETNNGDDIRSLIFQEDGHVYTSWSSKASKLF